MLLGINFLGVWSILFLRIWMSSSLIYRHILPSRSSQQQWNIFDMLSTHWSSWCLMIGKRFKSFAYKKGLVELFNRLFSNRLWNTLFKFVRCQEILRSSKAKFVGSRYLLEVLYSREYKSSTTSWENSLDILCIYRLCWQPVSSFRLNMGPTGVESRIKLNRRVNHLWRLAGWSQLFDSV